MQPSAIDDLTRSGITPEDAEKAGIFDVEDCHAVYPDFDHGPGLVIPYYDMDGQLTTFERGGEMLPFCRVRYLASKQTYGMVQHKAQRYSQPGASGTRAYFPKLMDWRPIRDDAGEPVIITEGEKKAVAMCAAGFPTIALGGVFNFTNGGEELMPELDAIKWRGKQFYVAFDSDAALNPNILAAEARLVDELQRKRGGEGFLLRLPHDGDDKVGLDDFLVKFGPEALVTLLQNATSLGALDAKVITLNRSVVWIEKEGMVYDKEEKQFIKKDNFVSGSRFSALKHITLGSKQRSDPKEISVAAKWLTHPHAARFGEILFRPGEGSVVKTDHGRPALNMWSGWGTVGEGDVQPFLDLTKYLFQNMREKDQDLPLKLMAYKAQHPEEKVPLAIVMIGLQGCGKTLWGECLMDAFAPYSEPVTSQAFHSEFQGWLERSLLVLINEAEGEDMRKGADVLKSLISDLKRPMNEKFRPARQINAYGQYIITSNRREVGAFAADDRRMIVVDCPPKREDAFYHDYLKPWRRSGGGKHLLGYLLRMDLAGWEPPATAPMTAEKHLSYVESLTSVQALAEQMKLARGENIVKLWLDQAQAWAMASETSSNPAISSAARATAMGINQMQIRPWYTPQELALLFPALVASLQGSKFDRNTPAGRISRELREAGVPYLVCKDDPRGFMWQGVMRQYLVVADPDEFKVPVSQGDFERLMRSWPSYGALNARRR